ncbi:hypothetical protein [Aeromicrobium sp. UC242_57]|uniref:hypothetical protein n=1 Tax=Aeromicrobium sp. UC242_57 TaxID=3374624 RepID=UPI0037A282FD
MSTRSTNVSMPRPRSPSPSWSREWRAVTSATKGGLVERDAMVYQASKRLSALHAAHDGLVFGRLNLVNGESRYIGRIGVRDAEREILLVDWRAPAAALFYQATAQEPSRRGPAARPALRQRHGHRHRGRPARR